MASRSPRNYRNDTAVKAAYISTVDGGKVVLFSREEGYAPEQVILSDMPTDAGIMLSCVKGKQRKEVSLRMYARCSGNVFK